jgi:ectoine hydroxylase-related dioxygenase (phytanoyl-CoA dioxygenase family)
MRETSNNQMSSARADLISKGACCLRGVFDRRWVEIVRSGIDECIDKPSPLSKTWSGNQGGGGFFQDVFAWRRVAPLRKFVFESPAARLAAELMGSSRINIYMDHLLVRDANTNKSTPWHHDTPYCFVDGDNFCAIWFPLDPIRQGEGIRLVSGSHRWGKMFLPVEFGSAELYPHDPTTGTTHDVMPDIDATPGEYDILSWELDVGDCVAFYCNVVHSAPAHLATDQGRRVYTSRWVGDDATYALRDWSVPPLPCDPGLKHGDQFGGDLFPRVL